MLSAEDREWIKSNRLEISENREIGANFYYKGMSGVDIDTGEPGSEYELPPILLSGVFKDNGTQKIVIDNNSGTELTTKLFLFAFNSENLYFILETENKIVKTDEDALNYLGVPSIPEGYSEKLDKIEIPADSGKYFNLFEYDQTGMGADYNKVNLKLVEYGRIF